MVGRDWQGDSQGSERGKLVQDHPGRRHGNYPFARLLADLRRRYPGQSSAYADEGGHDVDTPLDAEFAGRLERLPKEVGALLIVIGIAGVLLPGPVGSPFILAGGLVLWPSGFNRVEGWFERKFPGLHRSGVTQIDRYLGDLERRYPGSTA